MLHHASQHREFHLRCRRCVRVAPASDAMHLQESRLPALLLVRPFAGLPPATMASADLSLAALQPSPFQTLGEISPGKNAILHRTTARSTQLRFDHKSFASMCMLALLSRASYPVLVHRLAASFHASFLRSVTLAQLHFLSLAVVSSREDFHLQDRAHAGRTHPPRPEGREFRTRPCCAKSDC